MNDQKNKYKQFENQTFVFNGKKIFIQKIKELSDLIIIHIAGDTLNFTKDNIQREFFDKISSKFDNEDYRKPIEFPQPKADVIKKHPKDTILQDAAAYLKTDSKPTKMDTATTPPQATKDVEQFNTLNNQLNHTGVFEGFDVARDSLLDALAKIQQAKSKEERDEAIQESKAVSEITGQINELAKTIVHAAGLLMKYKTK